jgi:hypothetical protein
MDWFWWIKMNYIIENSMKKALWEKMPCTCKKGIVMEEHPIKNCHYCRCKIAWDSVPKKSFTIKDSKGKDQTVNKITLIRGKYEDIIGWTHDNGGKK